MALMGMMWKIYKFKMVGERWMRDKGELQILIKIIFPQMLFPHLPKDAN